MNTTIFKKTLNNLNKFYVEGNELQNIQEVINCLISELMDLIIDGSPLGEFGADIFARLKHLDLLSLDGTGLKSFDINNVPDLTFLYISNNSNLTIVNLTLPSDEYSEFEELWAENCNLTELIGLNYESYPSLKILHIEGNPMSCEYVMKLKEQWEDLEVESDACEREGSDDQDSDEDDEEEDIGP